MDGREMCTRYLFEYLQTEGHLEDLTIDVNECNSNLGLKELFGWGAPDSSYL
jgi:hypothetical protein